MDYSKLTTEQIETLIKIFRELLQGEYSILSEHNKAKILEELREANLEIILDR